MTSKNEQVQLYNVLILRRDQQHIELLETDNYDEAHVVWTKAKDNWVECLKETKTFVLERPIVTAFDPGLIYEIRIAPVVQSKNMRHNPYAEEMKREGFSRTFGNFTGNTGLLDGGFKN